MLPETVSDRAGPANSSTTRPQTSAGRPTAVAAAAPWATIASGLGACAGVASRGAGCSGSLRILGKNPRAACHHCVCGARQTDTAPRTAWSASRTAVRRSRPRQGRVLLLAGSPIAIGIMPTIIAVAVISTGRIRVRPAEIAASKAAHAGQLLLAREGDEQDRIGRPPRRSP